MTVAVQISFTDPTPTQASLIAALLGGTAPAPSTAGTGTTAPPAAVEYFPADPALAPFPSPEGSRISVVSGKVYLYDSSTKRTVQRDDAYLRDKNGGIHSYKQPLALAPTPLLGLATGYLVLLNGAPNPSAWWQAQQVAIQAGIAWVQVVKWFYVASTGGSGGNIYDLPPYQPSEGQQFAAPVAGGSGTLPAAPAPVSPAPGSSGNIIKAGPSQTIKTLAGALAAANNGDTIQLDPATYAESVVITKAVKISGGGTVANSGTAGASWSGGAKIDVTGVVLAQGKGALVPMTDCIFDGLEITGAGLQETAGGGTSGVRNGGPGNFTVRNCYIHDNQDGVFSGGYAATWLLETNLLRDNGIGDGKTHNVYIGPNVVSLTANNVTSIMPPMSTSALRASGTMNNGHALKSRANVTTVNGGYYYAADAACINIPDGSTQPCVITGATVEKKAGDANHLVLQYAVESQGNGLAGVKFVGGTSILNCATPVIQSGGAPVMFDPTFVFQGTKPVVQ